MSLCRVFDCATENPFPFLRRRGLRVKVDLTHAVAAILDDVRSRGDSALLQSARRFDAPELRSIVVSSEELENACVPEEQLAAIRQSIARVRKFHEAQFRAIRAGWEGSTLNWTIPAHEVGDTGYEGQRMLPLSKAGIYVPGGKATYPSSVIMNCIPALVAGVEEVVITTPARPDGTLSDAVLVAARELGITKIFKVGGAAAIAALAFGTESVPRVDKLAGPGNMFVNEAKRQLWGYVGLDLYAGPSEVCVLADDSANAEWAAADWLTQVEHSEDNAGFLVTLSQAKADEIIAAAARQIEAAPRKEILSKALQDCGAVFVCETLENACEVVNAIAPEHLSVLIEDPESALPMIQNSGCILLGGFTPQSAGDFVSGPSHTLPTAQGARFSSPLNVLDFLKVQSISYLTRTDLEAVNETIEQFGKMEGLPLHGGAGTIRIQ